MSKLPFLLTWGRDWPGSRQFVVDAQGHMRFLRGRPILRSRSRGPSFHGRAQPYASHLLDPSVAPNHVRRLRSFQLDSPAPALTL